MGYTGIAQVSGLDLATWVRQLLRGEGRTVLETLQLLEERSTASFGLLAAQHQVAHGFVFGGFEQGATIAGVVGNVRLDRPGGRVEATFARTAWVVRERGVVIVAGGGQGAIDSADRALLERIAQHRPADPKDYERVLGDVNKRAFERGEAASRLISRSSATSYMPPTIEPFSHSVHYWDEGMGQQPVSPMLLFGIDLTEIMEVMTEDLDQLRSGKLSDEEHKRRVEEAGRRSVEGLGT